MTSTAITNRIAGLLLLATLVLIILKLSGHHQHGWWFVFAPLWGTWLLLCIAITLFLVWRLFNPRKVQQP